jgi:hypothetical protein
MIGLADADKADVRAISMGVVHPGHSLRTLQHRML